MSLDTFFESVIDVDAIKSKIRQRRSQMLIHSCIYYQMDQNLISDDKWQEWANELAELQTKYPECCKINFFDIDFSDWTGDSGFNLPLRNPWVWGKSLQLLNTWEKYNDGYNLD